MKSNVIATKINDLVGAITKMNNIFIGNNIKPK